MDPYGRSLLPIKFIYTEDYERRIFNIYKMVNSITKYLIKYISLGLEF